MNGELVKIVKGASSTEDMLTTYARLDDLEDIIEHLKRVRAQIPKHIPYCSNKEDPVYNTTDVETWFLIISDAMVATSMREELQNYGRGAWVFDRREFNEVVGITSGSWATASATKQKVPGKWFTTFIDHKIREYSDDCVRVQLHHLTALNTAHISRLDIEIKNLQERVAFLEDKVSTLENKVDKVVEDTPEFKF